MEYTPPTPEQQAESNRLQIIILLLNGEIEFDSIDDPINAAEKLETFVTKGRPRAHS